MYVVAVDLIYIYCCSKPVCICCIAPSCVLAVDLYIYMLLQYTRIYVVAVDLYRYIYCCIYVYIVAVDLHVYVR